MGAENDLTRWSAMDKEERSQNSTSDFLRGRGQLDNLIFRRLANDICKINQKKERREKKRIFR